MRFRLLPLAAVVAVLVAACGGSSTPTTTKTTSHKAKATQTKTSASAGTSAGSTSTSSGSSTTSASSGSTSTTPSFASLKNCTQLSGIGSEFSKAMTAATSGGKINLDEISKAYQDLANAAPSAIKPAIEKLSSAFTAYLSALNAAGYKAGSVPSATQLAKMESAVKLISASDVTNAAKSIEAWAVKNCTA